MNDKERFFFWERGTFGGTGGISVRQADLPCQPDHGWPPRRGIANVALALGSGAGLGEEEEDEVEEDQGGQGPRCWDGEGGLLGRARVGEAPFNPGRTLGGDDRRPGPSARQRNVMRSEPIAQPLWVENTKKRCAGWVGAKMRNVGGGGGGGSCLHPEVVGRIPMAAAGGGPGSSHRGQGGDVWESLKGGPRSLPPPLTVTLGRPWLASRGCWAGVLFPCHPPFCGGPQTLPGQCVGRGEASPPPGQRSNSMAFMYAAALLCREGSRRTLQHKPGTGKQVVGCRFHWAHSNGLGKAPAIPSLPKCERSKVLCQTTRVVSSFKGPRSMRPRTRRNFLDDCVSRQQTTTHRFRKDQFAGTRGFSHAAGLTRSDNLDRKGGASGHGGPPEVLRPVVH